MTGEIGAMGDVATGALLGRAVEPHAGETATGAHGHGLCLNCGTALIGDYCYACGQSAHVHRTLGSIVHDLLHGVFHFEGKIWRTFPMLVLHPGSLTRRYIAGERARFVSPLALFLFMVFVMFASIHSFSGDLGTAIPPVARTEAVKNIDADLAKARAELAQATAKSGSRSSEDITALRSTITSLQITRSALGGKMTNVKYLGDNDFKFSDGKTGWKALDDGLAKANANPGLALYKLQASAYKYSWALIPISTPFVALLFLWRRQYKMYDHAIFVTYSLSFMMGLVVALRGLMLIHASDAIFGLVLMLAPPVHMFVQLRGAYQLRKRSALWRTIALSIFAWIALTAFVMLLLAMGLMG